MRQKGVLRSVVLLLAIGALAGCGEHGRMEGKNRPGVTQGVQRENEAKEQAESTPGVTQEVQKENEPEPTQEVQTENGPKVTEEPELACVYGAMPILLIETEQGKKIADDKVYTNCTVSVTNCEKAYELTEVMAGIRIRGNSTQMYEKKPYRIKFEEKQQMLGLSEGAHKSWVLLAEWNDPTLLRNMITYRLANALSGISYATDCTLVEVYLNGEYAGVYLLAEQTQVDEDRIALDETGVADPSVTDTGYLLELEADASRRNEEGKEGEAWFAVTGYASEQDNSMQLLMERTFDESAAYYVVKSDARSAEQMAYMKDYMIQVYDAVYKEKTEEAVEELVDLASAADMYLVQLIANDYDNNYSSMYLYKDAGGKLMFGAPWDFDLAYGNFAGHTAAEDTVYVYHLLRQLGEYDWFRELVAKRYAELTGEENGPVARLKTDVRTFTKQYAEEFDREYTRWREDLIGVGGFGAWGAWEQPEDFGGFGNWGEFELPEGAEGFGGFGDWGAWEQPEGFGGFGTMENFSYGSVYDTHEEAAESLLVWLDARLTWVEEFLQGKQNEK